MCDYCENDRTLLQKDELIDEGSFGWGDVKVYRSQCVEYSLAVLLTGVT